jgi:hypothetical protein
MARMKFWRSAEGGVINPATNALVPFATGTAWTASAAGTQITDMQYIDSTGASTGAVPSGVITADADGFVPSLNGPPDGSTVLFLDFGHGRFAIESNDVTLVGATQSYVDTSVGTEATTRASGDTSLQVQITPLAARPRIWIKENGAVTPSTAQPGDLIAELAVSSLTYLSTHEFDAQAGADGAAVITGDTGLAAAAATIVKTGPLRGSGSIRCAGTTSKLNATTEVTAVPDYRCSFIVKFESNMVAAINWDLARSRNTGGAVNGIGVRLGVGTTPPDLRPSLVNSSNPIGSQGARAPTNGETWRFELVANHGVTPMTADLYIWYPVSGNLVNAWNAAPDEHLSATGTWTMTATGATRMNFGIITGQAANPSVVFDSVRFSRAAQGPHLVNS